jgi:hypothetical protein
MKVIDLKQSGTDQLASDWLNFARFSTITGRKQGAEDGKQYKVASFKYEPIELRNYADYAIEELPKEFQELGQSGELVNTKFWREHDPILIVPQKINFLRLFYTQKNHVRQWLFRLPAYLVNETGGVLRVLANNLEIQTGVNSIGDGWFQEHTKYNLDILLDQEILFFTLMRFADETFPVGTIL